MHKPSGKNKNCMENMLCPKCGNENELVVQASMWVSLMDDGTDPFADATRHCGEVDWDSDSPCFCPECNWRGIVNDFICTEVEV